MQYTHWKICHILIKLSNPTSMDLHKIQVSVLRSVELYFNSPTLQTTHRYASTSSADAQACGIYSTEYTQQGKRTLCQAT